MTLPLIDLNALIKRVRLEAAAPKGAPLKKSPAQHILEDILAWKLYSVVFQELHQTCSCCQASWISVNGIMIQRRHERTGALRTAYAHPDIPHDSICGLPREKLIIEQQIPMCPDCFQLQEILDLVRRPQNVGLEQAQKDLFA